MYFDHPLTVSITVLSSEQLASVYALLGGASLAALSTGNNVGGSPGVPARIMAPAHNEAPAPQGTATIASGAAPAQSEQPAGDDSGEVDRDGWAWSADMHASTKNRTKEGLWRMKVGVARPNPKPGFPRSDAAPSTGVTGTSANGTGSAPTGSANGSNAGPATTTTDDDDEFAAFRAAADKASATDNAAAAAIPTRKWTDADLGALCNQAAVKLGDPAPIKATIAEFVAEGQVPHSRNIPDDRRAEFAAKVEQTAGITFAG